MERNTCRPGNFVSDALVGHEHGLHDWDRSLVSAPRLLLSRCLACLATLACLPIVLEVQLPIWLQPTIVGLLWGAQFVAGFILARVHSGKFWATLASLACAIVFGLCFFLLTDLAADDCLLVSALLISVGWLTARVDQRPRGAHDRATPRHLRQYSLADMAFATTIAACLSRALPHLSAPPLLLFSVLVALAAGLICSWIAYRWVWKDECSLPRILLIFTMLALATGLLIAYVPTGMTVIQALAWLATGPANVIAAQAAAVLLRAGYRSL